jgi:hypothetical protein
MRRLGHAGRRIDVLKGCEHDAFAAIWPLLDRGEIRVGQVLVELHGTNMTQLAAFFADADAASFAVFSKDRNYWGFECFRCVDYSFMRRRAVHRFVQCGGGG